MHTDIALSSETALVPAPVLFTGKVDPFGEATVTRYFPCNMSIDDMLLAADVLPRPGAPLFVTVDGEAVLANRWETTFPEPGQHVTARNVPRGFVLGPVIAAAVAGAVGGGTVGAIVGAIVAAVVIAVIYTGVSMLISLIVSAVIGTPDQPNNDFASPKQSPTIKGAQNRAWLGSPVWRVYGKHRVTFPLAALPYTRIKGGRQHLVMLLSAGYGPVEITDLRIGDTPIGNYDDVSVTIHEGAVDFATLSKFSRDVKQDPLSIAFDNHLRQSATHDHTLTQAADRIECEFHFPYGLYMLHDAKGARDHYRVGIGIWLRRLDPTPTSWLEITDAACTGLDVNSKFNWSKAHTPVITGTLNIVAEGIGTEDDDEDEDREKWFRDRNWSPSSWWNRYYATVVDATATGQLASSKFYIGQEITLSGFVDSDNNVECIITHRIDDNTLRVRKTDTAFVNESGNGNETVSRGESKIWFTSKRNEGTSISIGCDVPFGRGDYEVRVIRYAYGRPGHFKDGQYFPTNRGGNAGEIAAAYADFGWTAARSIRYTNSVRLEGQALVELDIRSSKQLSGVIANLNGFVQSKLPKWNGSSFDAASVTRNPAWIALDILRGTANPDPIADARIDLDAFKALADICQLDPGVESYVFAYDRVFDFDTVVGQAMIDVLSVAYASPHMEDGLHTLVIDTPQSVPKQHFTPRNTSGYRYARPFVDRPHAVKVKFINPSADWRLDELQVYDDGYGWQGADTGAGTATIAVDGATNIFTRSDPAGDFLADGFATNGFAVFSGFSNSENNGQFLLKNVTALTIEVYETTPVTEGAGTRRVITKGATKFETLELAGVTNVDQAWRYTRLKYRFAQERAEFQSFEVDWEYLVSQRGDMCLFSHFTISMGTAWGRVVERHLNVAGTHVVGIELDTACTYEVGETYGAACRLSDNDTHEATVVNPAVAAEVESNYLEYTTPQPIASAPGMGDLMTFGKTNLITEEVIIVKVQPLEELRARVLVQAHAPDAFTEVGIETVPVYNTAIREPDPPELLPPAAPAIASVEMRGHPGRVSADGTADAVEVWTNLDVYNEDSPNANPLFAYPHQYQLQWRIKGFTDDEGITWEPTDWNDTDESTSNYYGDSIGFIIPDVTFTETDAFIVIQLRVRAISSRDVASAWSTTYETRIFNDVIETPLSVAFSNGYRVSRGDILPTLVVTWSYQGDEIPDAISGFHLQIWRDGNPYVNRTIYGLEYIINNPEEAIYTVELTAKGGLFGSSDPVTASIDYTPNLTRVTDIPAPHGLAINGNDRGTFNGTNVRLTWEPVVVGDIPDIALEDGVADSRRAFERRIESYRVMVMEPYENTIVRSEIVQGEQLFYDYDLDKNAADGGGPRRFFRFMMQAVDVNGDGGRWVTFHARNVPPALPRIEAIESRAGKIRLKLDASSISDEDYRGVMVWAQPSSQLSDADLTEDTLIFKGQPVEWIEIQPTQAGVWYLRYAAYDAFDEADPTRLNVSGNNSISTQGIGYSDLADDAAAKVSEVSTQGLVLFEGDGTDSGVWTDVIEVENVEIVGSDDGGASYVQLEAIISGVIDRGVGFINRTLISQVQKTALTEPWTTGGWGAMTLSAPFAIAPVFEYRVQSSVSGADSWTTIYPPVGLSLKSSVTAGGYGVVGSDSFGILVTPGNWDFRMQAQWTTYTYTQGLARYIEMMTAGPTWIPCIEGQGTAWRSNVVPHFTYMWIPYHSTDACVPMAHVYDSYTGVDYGRLFVLDHYATPWYWGVGGGGSPSSWKPYVAATMLSGNGISGSDYEYAALEMTCLGLMEVCSLRVTEKRR